MSGNTTYFGIQYPSSSDYVKDGATAIQTVADGFDSAVAIPTYNAQTGTTYTFVLADTSKTVTASNAAASTYTIPPQASVVWVADTTLSVTNLGAGVVTFVGGSGVTVTNTAQTLTQYQSAQLIRTGSDAWTVVPTSGIASSPGLTLVKTQTIGTTVSSVNVTSAFSATYDAYKIVIANTVTSASSTITMILGSTATGYYYVTAAGLFSTGASSNQNGAANATSWLAVGSTPTTNLSNSLEILSPFLTAKTYYNSTYVNVTGGAAGNLAGYLDNTTSYTAFTLTPASGTLTGGTIYVYGYNK
jgi:hypothetical protein